MAKVFIVNKAGHDFSSAESFGELVPVTTGNINVFRPDRDLFRIQEVLFDFDPQEDYLLLSGNVFANAMAVACIYYKYPYENLSFLVYDAKNNKYLKHTLTRNRNKEVVFQRDEKKSGK